MHFLAFVIVCIWGTTFISTKVLLNAGLTPADIFTVRFAMAAVVMSLVAPKRLWTENWKDELSMIALGIMGGSLYFLTENAALQHSYCSNVSFIVCSTPLYSNIALSLFYPSERLGRRQWLCCLVSLLGMALVVFNGQYVLHLAPLGDMLALAAALCWSLYSLAFRYLQGRYNPLLVSRKTFNYGLLTMLPFLPFTGSSPENIIVAMQHPTVLYNLLFLGVVASLGCYFLWNVVMQRLGVNAANAYLFLNPVATCIVSWLVLDEQITPLAIIGGALILLGLKFNKGQG